MYIDKQGSSKNATDVQQQATSLETATLHTMVTHNVSSVKGNYVILSTTVINAFDSAGNKTPCRALLDNGSQANLITREFLSQLSLTTRQQNISIVGINQMVSKGHSHY